MSIVRNRQPALTRVVPHQGNRRYAVPQHIGPVNLLLVGDSWTDDTYSHGQYPAVLPPGDRITVVNEGAAARPFTNTYAGSVEAGMAGWLSANPATDIAVVCSTGINDIGTAVTDAALQDAANSVIADCAAANAKVIFVGMIRSSSWAGARNTQANDFDVWLRELCAVGGHGSVPCVGTVCNDSQILATYAEDPTHLNQAGANVLAGVIMGVIKATKYRKAGSV